MRSPAPLTSSRETPLKLLAYLMNKMNMNLLTRWCCLLLFSVAGMQSCTTPRELRYLQGTFDTAQVRSVLFKNQLVQKNDLLSIIVYSENPTATAVFNQPVGAAASLASASPVIGGEINSSAPALPSGGYLVGNNGDIEYPIIGRLHVEGLTKDQLVDLLNSRLKDKYLTNPYYTIRFLNFKITMVGEVVRPGMYTIPSERINIFEAIGLAGDLTFFGQRTNILIIRETNGKREFGRLDITRPDVFNSPYFNLQQNDVVLVDLNKRKVAANDNQLLRGISVVSAIISTLAVTISLLRR